MIKKNKLLVIFVVLLSISTINASEIYNKNGNKLNFNGKINIRNRFFNNKDVYAENEDNSKIRLGINGVTQVTNDLIGYGCFELETKINKTEIDNNYKNRLSYLGIKSTDYGSIDYGRNYGIIYDTASWTDVLPLWGGDSISQSDTYMTGRNRNLLTYRNKNTFGYIEGLNFALQYQIKNIEDINDINSYYKQNGNGYGFSTSYNIGWGLTLGGGFSNSFRSKEQKTFSNPSNKYAQAWNIGGKFDANNLYLAGMYGETFNTTHFGKVNYIANKTKNVELVAQYLLDHGLKPSIAYIQSKGKNLEYFNNKSIVKYISIGSHYDIKKNISALIDYKINLLKNSVFTREVGINTDNVIGLGLTYKF